DILAERFSSYFLEHSANLYFLNKFSNILKYDTAEIIMCQLQISVDMDITLNRMTLEKLKYFKRFINKNTLLPTPFSIDYGVESSIFLLAGLSGAAVIIFFILYQYYYTYKLGLFKEKHIWKSLGEFDNEGSPEDSARIESKFKWIFSKAAARQLKYPARRLRNSNIVVLYASTGEIL